MCICTSIRTCCCCRWETTTSNCARLHVSTHAPADCVMSRLRSVACCFAFDLACLRSCFSTSERSHGPTLALAHIDPCLQHHLVRAVAHHSIAPTCKIERNHGLAPYTSFLSLADSMMSPVPFLKQTFLLITQRVISMCVRWLVLLLLLHVQIEDMILVSVGFILPVQCRWNSESIPRLCRC